MSYSEIDVQEVMEGHAPPAGMTSDSKREVVRRLDEGALRNRLGGVYTARMLADLLGVDPRTVTRYRSRNRQEATAAQGEFER